MFLSSMHRRIHLNYEKDTDHLGLKSFRFIASPKVLGSCTELDESFRNENNQCFSLEDEGFSYFKSGVLNLGPCLRKEGLPRGIPLAISFPHFYHASNNSNFLDNVHGLHPDKDKHQLYVDIH